MVSTVTGRITGNCTVFTCWQQVQWFVRL